MKTLFPWLAALAAAYLILPPVIPASLLLLTVLPLVVFAWGLAYGIRVGARPGLAVWAALLFLPAVLLHYDASALVYGVFFGITAIIGNVVGSLFRKK